MLKTRIVTAICLLGVFLSCLFFLPSSWFAKFIAIVFVLAAWEWAGLSGFNQWYQKALYCVLSGCVAVTLSLYVGLFAEAGTDFDKIRTVFLSAGLWWAVALLWVQGYPSSSLLWGSGIARLIMGLLVLIPSGIALVHLHQQDYGQWLILSIVLIVATADTSAYFAGKAFGRRKLAASVSPGKTWEGVVGGITACVVLSFIMALLIDIHLWRVIAAIVVPTALVSVLGDLLESMVKRHCGMKDSGRILPGHGGLLDRIDGLTAAAPIFALALILASDQLPL